LIVKKALLRQSCRADFQVFFGFNHSESNAGKLSPEIMRRAVVIVRVRMFRISGGVANWELVFHSGARRHL
jgi:hypothetical protein